MDRKTARHLSMLLERRRRFEIQYAQASEALCLAVLEASELGASRLDVARSLGVGTSTVQGWVERGRHIRGA